MQPTIHAPQWFASLLTATFGHHATIDELLDDLEQAFQQRAASQGIAAANRWYRWEALSALPYCFRNAIGTTTWQGAGRLALNTVSAVLLVLFAEMIIGTVVYAALSGLGISVTMPPSAASRWWYLPWLPVAMLFTLCLGYVGAWLDRAQPLRVAGLCSLLVGAWTIFAMARLPNQGLAMGLPYAVLQAAGVLGGGLLRLRHWQAPPARG